MYKKQQSMADLINTTITKIVGEQTEASSVSDYIKKNIYVFSAMILCYSYCYFISSRIPKALFRIISLIPIAILLIILPFYLPPSFSPIIVASLVAWPSLGRLILFAFDKGPISSQSQYHNFILYTALPMQEPSTENVTAYSKMNTKILMFAVILGFISKYKEVMEPGALKVSYCVFIYLYLECVETTAKNMFRSLTGLDLMPVFHEPYLSTSLQDFWGRRWNQLVSSVLQESVYKPVKSGAEVLVGKGLAPAPAYMATFLVSGLMHELLLLCLTRENPSWEMTAFFVLHGICVALEVGMKKALKGRLSLPRWFKFVSTPLTVGFVALTSVWLFFPPVIRGGVDLMVCREFGYWRELFQSGMKLPTRLKSLGEYNVDYFKYCC